MFLLACIFLPVQAHCYIFQHLPISNSPPSNLPPLTIQVYLSLWTSLPLQSLFSLLTKYFLPFVLFLCDSFSHHLSIFQQPGIYLLIYLDIPCSTVWKPSGPTVTTLCLNSTLSLKPVLPPLPQVHTICVNIHPVLRLQKPSWWTSLHTNKVPTKGRTSLLSSNYSLLSVLCAFYHMYYDTVAARLPYRLMFV